tara:strand:+ start:3618 stop:3986 length:369 start_codon:yes stop_codon:yes gene_type:complete
MKTLKEKIKAEYSKQGYTLATFAQSLNMSPSNLGNQIAKDDTVQLSLIKKICEQLNLSIGYILESQSSNQTIEEGQVITDQLLAILDDGDEDTVDLIVGKISREHARVARKKVTASDKIVGE